jgi:dynein heavy chain
MFCLCLFAASNLDIVDKLEGLIALWSKEIEQVLAESEQVRPVNFISYSCILLHWERYEQSTS